MLIILVVGLGLDTARVLLGAHHLQNTADAAALAGAQMVKIDQTGARRQALSYASQNSVYADPVLLDLPDPGNDSNDVIVGTYNRRTQVFTPATRAPNAVKVVARRTTGSLGGPLPLVFGPIANVLASNIARYAIAISSGTTGAGLICLSPAGVDFYINGSNLVVDVNNGDIQVNSDDPQAVEIDGQPTMYADELNVCGLIDPGGAFEFSPDLPVNTGVEPIPDPLCPDPASGRCLPPPTWNPANDLSNGGATLTIGGGSVVLEPGYYSGGFNISGGNVILKSGIYVLGGGKQGKGGLVVGGSANFCARGVMFYITNNGKVDIGGTGDVRVTPLPVEGEEFEGFCNPSYSLPPEGDPAWTYAGVSIFQDRANTREATITGTSLLDLDGTLYFPTAKVNIRGTGDGFGNQLICGKIDIRGSGNITIDYDGRNRVVGYRSYLVE